MKICRIGNSGKEIPACMDDDGNIRDLSAILPDITASNMSRNLLTELTKVDVFTLPIIENMNRFSPPIGNIHQVVGIGLNYEDHIEEAGLPRPAEPTYFLKAASSISGANDPIVMPKLGEKLDYEIELALIISTRCNSVSIEEARANIAGYTIINDVSERAFQLERGTQWTQGKSAETFGPIGPWLVTADEIEDPNNLNLTLSVNGQIRQNSNTKHLVFKPAELVSYVSHFMTLLPGDVIATGTPGGVGAAMSPPSYLKAGDTVELEIDQLGQQSQRVIPFQFR